MTRIQLRNEIATIDRRRKVVAAVMLALLIGSLLVIADIGGCRAALAVALGAASLFFFVLFLLDAADHIEPPPDAESDDFDYWEPPHPNRLWRAAMGLFVAALACWLSSCSGAGLVSVRPDGSLTSAPLASLLGKQSVARIRQTVSTPQGLAITTEIEGYNTQNPDPELTSAVKTGYLGGLAAGVTKALAKETAGVTKHLNNNATAVTIKGLDNEAAKVAGQQAMKSAP